jgi:uncharacterized protein (TIGR00159 family)
LSLPLAFQIGFLSIDWADAADILLVGVLMYEVSRFVRRSVAGGILVGGLVLYIVYWLVKAAGMDLLTAILDQFMGVGVVAALILFQPEIRKFLLALGKGTSFRTDFKLKKLFKDQQPDELFALQPAIEAARSMSQNSTGAMIVFERQDSLRMYAETGDAIDAVLSKRLLVSIFQKQSPLHDGAAIIRRGRVVAARCILPLSETQTLPAKRGMRHRAALGLTEATDAVVLIVSEQDGQISLAEGGRLEKNLSATEVRARLRALSVPL